MAARVRSLDAIRIVLADRSFSQQQIEKILNKLDSNYIEEPKLLGDVIDCWNMIMKSSKPYAHSDGSDSSYNFYNNVNYIAAVAAPPKDCPLTKLKVNMNTILADIEPELLNFQPDKLIRRHENIRGLGIANNTSEHWQILHNAPRGFYLQHWTDLSKKIMYIDQKVLELLHDKKEQKEMKTHPLIKYPQITELDFDRIRARYLFASRVGYRELSHMYPITKASTRPLLKDLLLSNSGYFLKKFAPFCTIEEYQCFSNLINQYEVDCDDSDIFEGMAELESLKYEAWPQQMKKSEIREAIREMTNK